MIFSHIRQIAGTLTICMTILLTGAVLPDAAKANPFASGWTLDTDASELRVLSIKKQVVAESSQFATFGGTISGDGAVEIRILLDSIDTKIDLRNVRMRFLFFETFKFPEAVISAQLTPDMVAGLAQARRKSVDLDYSINLHGIQVKRTDRVLITLLDDNRVAISTTNPIILSVADFDLVEGLQKLMEAASVDIVPIATVSFDVVFNRDGAASATASPVILPQSAAPATAALETQGNFDAAACIGRFEILSRTGNIFFRSGSAELDPESLPLLRNVVDIVRRCPGMKLEVAGHTDSDGDATANQTLSEARAGAVSEYLTRKGIESVRISTVGYGESRPAFDNTSAQNKRRNRRIEFTALEG